jgi:uncharacterized protein (DUF486 family)
MILAPPGKKAAGILFSFRGGWARSPFAHLLLRSTPMRLATLVLLTLSNVFMTFAWYGHLKYKNVALWTAILISWLIAFVEYCFQVPANRIGHNAGVTTAQLKTFQEVITLAVFCCFSVLYLKEPLKWNYLMGFALIAFGALFVFAPWQRTLP